MYLKSGLRCKAHTINSEISKDSAGHPAHHFFINDLPIAIHNPICTTITHKSLAVSVKSLVYDSFYPSRFFWLQHKSHTLSSCSLEQWKQGKKPFSCADLMALILNYSNAWQLQFPNIPAADIISYFQQVSIWSRSKLAYQYIDPIYLKLGKCLKQPSVLYSVIMIILFDIF